MRGIHSFLSQEGLCIMQIFKCFQLRGQQPHTNLDSFIAEPLRLSTNTQHNTTQHKTRKHVKQGYSERVFSPSHRPLTYTTPNKRKRQTSIRSAGFEPAIPVIKRRQTCALESTDRGIGNLIINNNNANNNINNNNVASCYLSGY